MPYQLRTFGGFDLLGPEGQQLEAVRPNSKGAALLVYLAARPAGEEITREELLSVLWPERTEDAARNALRITLSRLRSALPEGTLGGKGKDRLWLAPSRVETDVQAFEQALEDGRYEDALDLYQGPFLEHFYLAETGPFDRWMDERREAYRREAYRAALSVGERAAEEGELERAEGAYRRALELAPVKEEAAARLISILAERGKRSDALQLHEAFTRRLREELDLVPTDRLQELAERVRSTSRTRRGLEGQRVASGSGDGTASGGGQPDPASRGGTRPVLWTAATLLLLALAGVGLWYGLRADTSETATDPAVDRTVAVLPFRPLGQEKADDFGAAVHAGLLTRLANISELHVISGTSVRRYQDTEKPLPEIARELNAGWVVEGEIQRTGDEVRVNAQLVNGRTDTHLWAESYTRGLTAENLFEIQEELTRRIARALEVELSHEDERQVASVPTKNTAAYELFLQAEQMARLGEATVTRERLNLYRRALALDTAFAEAWAGLADAYTGHAWLLGWSKVWADSGRRAARRALELDPYLADGYAQLGDALWILEGREAPVQAYRRALELQPGHREAANNLAVLLARRGDFAERTRLLDRLHRTAPRSPEIVAKQLVTSVQLGRDSVARAWRDYARAHDLALGWTEFDLALFGRGDIEASREHLDDIPGPEEASHRVRRRAALALYQGHWAKARNQYRMLNPGPTGASHPIFNGFLDDQLALAWSLDRLGQREEAREIAASVAREAEHQAEDGRNVRGPIHRLAVAHLIQGDTARALEWLESAVDLGYRGRGTLQTVPTLSPLRDHARLRALVARVDSLLAEERRRVEAEGWGQPR